MDKTKIKEVLNSWNFWVADLPLGKERNAYYLQKMISLLQSNFIVVSAGPRRAGKSVLLRQAAHRLIQQGIDKREVLMVNWEDYRWEPLDLALLEQIYTVFREEISTGKKPYLFLDEVHRLPRWEKFVRTLHELQEAQLCISGSTSKIISDRLGTVLTGRHLDLVVLPLSFREFLTFKGQVIADELSMLANKTKLRQWLREYLEFGGFPEVTLAVPREQKLEILSNYFSDIIHRDIVEKYKIKDVSKLRSLARFYLSNAGSLISFNKVGTWLKETVSTVSRFSSYFEEVYLLHFLKRFSYKVKEQENSLRKVYVYDVGLANALGFRFRENWGKLYENIVLLELLRQKNENHDLELFYWQDIHHHEVDFVVKEGLKVKQLIQVCFNLDDFQTKEREIRALLKAMEEFQLPTAFLITDDDEREELVDRKTIIFIPLWKWLLQSHQV
jgi:predicted AAA+ superfamily ATPase